ncbi:LCP family protein [Streptomyces capparidis]
MGHVQQPGSGYPPPQRPPAEPPLPPELSPRRAAAAGGIPAQTRPEGAGGGGAAFGPPARTARRNPGARPNWRRRIGFTALGLVLALLVTSVVTYFWADSKLRRDVDLSKVEDRPEKGKGTNYLIVGSDSREGLSDEEKKKMRTGSTDGRRTDSMILLHTGDNGTTMMSLPRDSWVTIPSFTGSVSGRRIPEQQNKLNAAFSIEGPELLVRTVEYNTGLRIDHYAEIGFDGFVDIVDAVGGVDMCLDKDIKDKNSGADLKKGCQTLSGTESLSFVRQRYQEAEGDLGRTKNQQKFLAALADQAATPGTVLNPFSLYPTMGAGLDSLVVDKDMGLWDVATMFWAMKGATGGDGKTLNVPVADPGFSTPKGSAVKWDMTRAKKLFDELKNDRKVTVQAQR